MIELNDEQSEAVKHRGSPLLIIAGAGTGKTAVITQRIVELIRSGDAKASEILALTFTEKASAEMIERVDLQMPIGYEDVDIMTFHSFCDTVLRQDGLYIGLDVEFDLMSEAQSYIFFRRHLFDMPLDKLRPSGKPTSNITSILRHFSRLQDEEVFPLEYQEFANSLPGKTEAEKEHKAEMIELANTYEVYTQLKITSSKLDFGDLIMQTLRLFRERPNILDKYHRKYRYILVDEFQDTNYTQNVLVNLLALGRSVEESDLKVRNKTNVTVVGDDDQAIYKFRGAAISNILHFKNTYPKTKRVVLTSNYRSRQEILDSAYQLIKKNDPDRLEVTEAVDKRLLSKAVFDREVAEPVKLLIADNGSEEANLVAKEILRLTGNLDRLKGGSEIIQKQFNDTGQAMFVDMDKGNGSRYKFSEIAILSRANNHADPFVQALKHYGIPFKFSGPKGLYSRQEIVQLISYLRVIADHTDDLSMYGVLKMDVWGLSARELVDIMRSARATKLSVMKFLENQWGIRTGEDQINSAEPSNLLGELLSDTSLSSISKLLDQIGKGMIMLRKGASIGETLFDFFKESGVMAELLSKENDAQALFQVQNISKYFEMIRSFEESNQGASILDYIDYLNYSMDIGENPSTESDALEGYDAVNLMSVHRSKGLEFPVIFLVNLVSERFPTRNRTDRIPIPDDLIKDHIPDVDATEEHLREERRLFYVGATRAKEILYLTAAKFYGDGKRAKKPSIFLDELLDRKVVDEFSHHEVPKLQEAEFAVHVSTEDDQIEFKELAGLDPQSVSYSQLDTYETCPKRYKYSYIYRIPGRPSSALAFGRSIHNTLRAFYSQLKEYQEGLEGFGNSPSVPDLLNYYQDKWLSDGYESIQHEQARREFGESILRDFHRTQFDPECVTVGLEVGFRYQLKNIIIKGMIDRIDLVGERNGQKIVELIDYKTGSLKSEADVRKNVQLVIYAIVAEEVFGYKVDSASLIFVEHGAKMSISIDQVRKDEVKEHIMGLVERIRSRDFTATPGFHCTYCDFRDICEDAMVES